MTDQEIHTQWHWMTEGGLNDSRVRDVERKFDEHKTWLRARYNVPSEVLTQLDSVRNVVVARVKRDIVLSVHWSGFDQVRNP
jgi:hypothetical protein